MMPEQPSPVTGNPATSSPLDLPNGREKGRHYAAAALRSRKLQRLIESAPPMTPAQIDALRTMLAAHPRLGD